MAKFDKNETYEKNKIRAIYRLTAILTVISIGLSVVFLNLLGNKNNLLAFSDNMFLAGTLLFALSIIINLIKNIFTFRNRNIFIKGNNKIAKIDGETLAGNLSNEERKLLLRHELFVLASRSFMMAGIVNIIISVLFAILV